MKTFIRIGCVSVLGLFLIVMIAAAIFDRNSAPTQSIMFLNTTDVKRSVTFERISSDGKLSDLYAVNCNLEPAETVIQRVPEGNYKIKVWDKSDSLVKSCEFKIALPNPKESNYELYRSDLAMDKIFVLANLNMLYEGNSFAETMSQAVGTKRETIGVEKLYDGAKPFLVGEMYSSRKFVDVYEDLPSDIKYGNIVYGLFPVPKNLKEKDLPELLYKKIAEKAKQ